MHFSVLRQEKNTDMYVEQLQEIYLFKLAAITLSVLRLFPF